MAATQTRFGGRWLQAGEEEQADPVEAAMPGVLQVVSPNVGIPRPPSSVQRLAPDRRYR
jgi:hypothetical protein